MSNGESRRNYPNRVVGICNKTHRSAKQTEVKQMDEITWHDGCIDKYSHRGFTKEGLISLIEKNFPDNNTMENIAVIQEVKSNKGVFQTFIFGKPLNWF